MLTGLGFVTAAVNALIRILFAMGREGVLPRSLSRLSRRHTPVVAIGCAAALALTLGLPLTYAYGGARIRISRRERRAFAGALVGLNALGQMFFIPAYPFWSLMIIAVDVVALWGLCTYGSRENLAA